MTGFSADWLRLREPFDHAARDQAAPALPWDAIGACRRSADGAMRIVDLACGTGSNLRWLAPRLGARQRWRLLDHDAQLLQQVPVRIAEWARHDGLALDAQGTQLRVAGAGWSAEIDCECRDLAGGLAAVLEGGVDLLSASALLDLVSARWVGDLAAEAARARCAMLFALNVDGRIEWQPALPNDLQVARLFAAHQQRDKGFGPALGNEAVAALRDCAQRLGYRCSMVASDWQVAPRLGEPHRLMHEALLQGMAQASAEQEAQAADAILAWQRQRRHCEAQAALCLGHVDFLALPAQR